MPYVRRRRYSNKRRSSTRRNMRRIKYRRPSARNQRRQILSNQRQIVSIKRALTLNKERCRWRMGFAEIPMTAYPFIIPLTGGCSTVSPALTNTGKPCTWDITMTATPQVDAENQRSKVVINTQYVDMSITGGTEPAPLYFTVFLVKLRKETAQQVYAETSGMTTLVRDTDFATPNVVGGPGDSGYGAYLNTERFKVMKRLEFMTVANTAGWPGGPPATNPKDKGLGSAVRRTGFKINYGNTVLNSTGGAANLQDLNYADIDPSHKYFLIAFSDNNFGDLEYPSCAISSLITGYTC